MITPKSRSFFSDTLVLASHNKGKLAELQRLLDRPEIKLLTAADLSIAQPEETGQTFVENATMKALLVSQKSGFPALADDSGLCVEALGGQPGVHSADWAGSPRDYGVAMRRLHTALENQPARRAYFVCCLVLAWPDGHVESVEARDYGTLVWPPRGAGGFGYDPMFMRDGETRTNAELSPEEKNAHSHRAKALAELARRVFGERQ